MIKINLSNKLNLFNWLIIINVKYIFYYHIILSQDKKSKYKKCEILEINQDRIARK